MPFRVFPLHQSWFEELDFDRPWIPTKRLPRLRRDERIPWPCAVDSERRVLMTQLLGNTYEMRDFYYRWLLAIGGDVVCIHEDMPRASMAGTPVIARHSYERLIALAQQARAALCPRCPAFQFEPLTPAYPPWHGRREFERLRKVSRSVSQLSRLMQVLETARSAQR